MSLKNSDDTIGNRTHDLRVCSVVPSPLRHRAPHCTERGDIKYLVKNMLHSRIACQKSNVERAMIERTANNSLITKK